MEIMENPQEDVKMVHSQHARILKEDDEIWISSEDLNTENSSDDDKTKTKHAFKKKLKLKTRKRSTPNIKLQRPSIPSVPSTSKDLDDRLLMPAATEDLHSRSTDDSRTSDEECHIPPIPTECLSKRLSLEDWRPMKGSLNVSTLEETSSASDETRKIAREAGNFYNAMLYKLKSLKSCPVLKSARKEKFNAEEKTDVDQKSFKYLKNTLEVRQQLDFINKLDKEIENTIRLYKTERNERFNTEFALCKHISEEKLGLNLEGDTEPFLKICDFKNRLDKCRRQIEYKEVEIPEQTNINKESNEIESEEEINSTEINDEESVQVQESDNKYATNFIRKNIYAAKEGIMANFSLTDEEKTKIADLLKDIDNFEMDSTELSLSTSSFVQDDEDIIKTNINNDFNAFSILEEEKNRMLTIDNELEKFMENQENLQKKSIPIKDEEFWKKFVLDQSLKDIDEKIEKLHVLESEDIAKFNSLEEDCREHLEQLKTEFPEIIINSAI